MNNTTLDIEKIRGYNARLKTVRTEYSKIESEVTYARQELTRKCQELTAELGKEVTPENIHEIYEAEVAKINRDVSMGEEILTRIATGNNAPDTTAQNAQAATTIPQTLQQAQPVVQAATDGSQPAVPWNFNNQPAPATATQTNVAGMETFEPFKNL